MKLWIKILFGCAVVTVATGCAIDGGYVPRIPREAQARLLEYKDLPENKVFVFAIDPNGAFAYGYDAGADTIKNAARAATARCNADREANDVLGPPVVYAVNNKVVFKDMIRRNAQ